MSDAQFKTTLANIVSAINTNKQILDEIKSDNAMVVELVNTIYQRVEDMGKKFDDVLNTGIKKPKTAAPKKETKTNADDVEPTPRKKPTIMIKASEASAESTEPVKIIKNIMTFFKTRYIADNTVFDDILEENQAESIFAEHAEELESKKEGLARDKAKALILYKKTTKAQRKKIREKMMDEHDATSVNNDEDVEAEVDSD